MIFFFSSRRRHTSFDCDWSSDVCSSDLVNKLPDKPLAVYDGLFPESEMGAQLRGVIPIGPTKLEYAAFVANAPGLITESRSEERRVGKECRSRWSPYH